MWLLLTFPAHRFADVQGDRSSPEQLKELIDPSLYAYVYDMNGREATDTAPLADIFASPKSTLKSFVYMSCKRLYPTPLIARRNPKPFTQPLISHTRGTEGRSSTSPPTPKKDAHPPRTRGMQPRESKDTRKHSDPVHVGVKEK